MTLASTLQRLHASADTIHNGHVPKRLVEIGGKSLIDYSLDRLADAGVDAAPRDAPNPWNQALWMLLADFAAAAVPIVPFVLLPIPQARIVSGVVSLMLLIGLGVGRARVAKHDTLRTVLETVAIGIAAALAGVGISIFIDRAFGG
jgi:VIT1/CCC1 family predicted Fe2+/Mn2+ transporter